MPLNPHGARLLAATLSAVSTRKKSPGPDPERLKIEGDWKDAVRKALEVERPEDGWSDGEDPDKARSKTPKKGRKRT